MGIFSSKTPSLSVITKAALAVGLSLGMVAASQAVAIVTNDLGVTAGGYSSLTPQFTCQSLDGQGTCASAVGINFMGGVNGGYTATGSFISLVGGTSGAVTFLGNINDLSAANPSGSALFTAGSQTFYWTSVTRNYKGNSSEFLIAGFLQGTGQNGGAKTSVAFDYTTQTDRGVNFSMQTIPLPGTVALLGLGMMGVGLLATRRRNA